MITFLTLQYDHIINTSNKQIVSVGDFIDQCGSGLFYFKECRIGREELKFILNMRVK